MANLTNIIKINETDYETLADGGSVVKDGQTYTFDENALYLVPDTSVTPEIPNDLGLSSSLLYLENDSGQIGTGINLTTLKSNLGLTNAVTSASTLTSGRVILGGGNRTISSSSYTIDTSKLSGSLYIPTSYVVQNAIDEAVNGLDLQITTADDESLGNLTLITNATKGVSLADINKPVIIELVGTSATSVGDHTITITRAQYNIIKNNYPNVIIRLQYIPNLVTQNQNYYIYLTPKSGTFTSSTSGIITYSNPEYIFEGGEVQIGDANNYVKCNISLSISALFTTSASATLTMSKVQTAKYQHNIRYYYQQTISSGTTKYVPTYFTATIINDSPTAFTASTLLSYLDTNGLTSSLKCLSISGIHRNSSGTAYILSGLAQVTSTNAIVYGMDTSKLENASTSLSPTSTTITLTNGTLNDTVVEI